MPTRVPTPSREDLLDLFRAQGRPLPLDQVYRLVSRQGFLGDAEMHGQYRVQPWEMEWRTRPVLRRLVQMAREGLLWRGGDDLWELAPGQQGELAFESARKEARG